MIGEPYSFHMNGARWQGEKELKKREFKLIVGEPF